MKFSKLVSFIRDYLIAIASFLLIFLVTIFIYSETRKKALERNEKLFEIKAAQITQDLELRMRDYVQILIGAKALIVASDTISRKDWQNYYATLKLEESYPGIQGVGYSHVVLPEEMPRHLRQIRAEGFHDYDIRPEGERDFYTSIIYLEPFNERNQRAFGFDMFSDSVRRSAMKMARDTRKPALSGKVRLMQETGVDEQAGFLIYLPVYKNNAEPESIKERQRLIKGFVYSPFRAKDLMVATLGDSFKDLDIEVYDGINLGKNDLLYSTDSVLHYHASEKRELDMLSTLNIGGHTWRIYYSAKPSYMRSADTELPYFILMGGTIIGLLMFFIIWSLINTHRSNNLKQIITDNATAALFMMDASGYCTFMNPAAEEMTGFTFDEIRKKPLHDMIHHTHPDGNPYPLEECPLDRALPTNNNMRAHEDVFIRKNGEFFSVTVAAHPIFKNGVPMATIIEVRDITEEKRAQQAMIESEARFRTMADNAPVMISILDVWKQSVYVNRQWLDFTGSTFEDSINFGWQKIIHPQDLPAFEDMYTSALAKEEGFRVETRMRRHDGQYRWMVATCTPRFGANDEFLGHISSTIDITDIKEADRKVKQNAELLQKLFLEVPALVGLVRASDKRYLLANPLYRKLFGNRQLVGKRLDEAHADLEMKGLLEHLEGVFESGLPFVGKEMPLIADGRDNGSVSENYFNLVFQPLMDSKGKAEAVLIFAVEVTELVQARTKLVSANDELSYKNTELQRINNDLDNFVYTASHDLKSPIANMEGLTSLLYDILEGKLEEDDKQVLDMVSDSINKLKQTIADLAEITKVQKELHAKVEPLAFEQVLQDVIADIDGLVTESEANIEADFQVRELLYARKNLRSIVYNLVSNAIKYRSPERLPSVRLSTHLDGEYVVLQVQDNGLGIKKQHQHKLFSMFKRLHNHVEGTGIGLYIVKRIIENNGGRIEVESELGQGTTFKVYFKQEPVAVPQT
ncbi:CHASE domain-containing protein [Pontibacter sp. JH31]|uniref:histidine kinase n=1 Tax=Pontibacter aquaedesilientis TaxID=2766980 RepID=A0ABR7XID8_9BACT|nr:CHASE domain-containing protein [Pontibacter aquaedesilientis]MBD1397408.1 CHASE domain-containing protein [Pontibacter aquaedesilientis]